MSEQGDRPIMDVRIFLSGFGNVGQPFAHLLLDRSALLATYGVQCTLVGVADSSGSAVNPAGLDIPGLLAAKKQGGVARLVGGGRPGMSAADALVASGATLLVEASPSNLHTGGMALDLLRQALDQGLHVVTANKGPLVVAFGELLALARRQGVGFRFAATVGAPLPIVETFVYGLPGCTVNGFAAIPNATSNCVLQFMEQGKSLEEGVRAAQQLGIAETDPTLDLDGWDTAAKVTILANALLGLPATISDVQVTGIRGLSGTEVAAARSAGQAIKLVGMALRPSPDGATATVQEDRLRGWRLTVAPALLASNHPLVHIDGTQMAIVVDTDLIGQLVLSTEGAAPMSTAAAILRDIINIARDYRSNQSMD